MTFARWLLVLCGLLALLLAADGTLGAMARGLPRAWEYISRFWPPDFSYLPKLIPPLVDTLRMSVYGTALAFLTAIPLAHLASRNLMPNTTVYLAMRGMLTVLRGTPAVILGILFVAAVGLGSTAGILGIWLHTTGVLGKYMSECFEGADQETLYAAQVDGATNWQSYIHVLVPMQANAIASFVLYYLEANFRQAAVLGFVGAGGIGMELMTAVGLFKYGRTGLIVLSVVAVALTLDLVSRKVREKLI